MAIDPLVLPIGFFFCICSIIGVTGNFILLVVILRTKKMRSPCHILIAITVFSDLIHECGQFPFVYSVFADSTQMLENNKSLETFPQRDCYWILFIPLIGVNLGAPMILAMGIDRLIAINFPAKYRLYQEMKMRYILVQMIFPTLFTFVLMYLGWKDRINANLPCAVPIGLMGGMEVYTYSGYVLYVLIIGIYIFAAHELRKKGGSSKLRAVFTSIAITVGFVCFGWLCTTITNTLSFIVFPQDQRLQTIMQQYAGITVNMSTASNFFVFYLKNAEYREAIRRLIGLRPIKIPGVEPSASMNTNVNGRRASTVTVETLKKANTQSVAPIE